MTDLEQFKAMLERAGVIYHEEIMVEDNIEIHVSTRQQKIIWGQEWCAALIAFKPDGSLLAVGATE